MVRMLFSCNRPKKAVCLPRKQLLLYSKIAWLYSVLFCLCINMKSETVDFQRHFKNYKNMILKINLGCFHKLRCVDFWQVHDMG